MSVFDNIPDPKKQMEAMNIQMEKAMQQMKRDDMPEKNSWMSKRNINKNGSDFRRTPKTKRKDEVNT